MSDVMVAPHYCPVGDSAGDPYHVGQLWECAHLHCDDIGGLVVEETKSSSAGAAKGHHFGSASNSTQPIATTCHSCPAGRYRTTD